MAYPRGWTLLDTKTGAGNPTALTFSTISGAYSALVIMGTARANTGASSLVTLNVQVNNDTAANYGWSLSYALNTTNTPLGSGSAVTVMSVAEIPDAAATAAEHGNVVIDIPNYANTAIRKTLTGRFTGAYAAGSVFAGIGGGRWASAAAITRIDLSIAGGLAFHTDTSFKLYGIA